MAQELRIVVVGCGGMSQAWIKITTQTPDVKIVGLVDVVKANALKRATQFNLPESIVFDSLEQAIAAAKPDMVFDVTIPAAHGPVTIAALKHGCHVLGEKPMSDSMDVARNMVAAAKKAGKLYAVTQTRRPTAPLHSAIHFLRSGAIGNIEEVHSDFYIAPHFGGFRDEMDDVLLVDMAIHTFDNARQIADADPVSVYCQSWNPPHSWYKGHASALAIFEMKDKAGNPIVYTYRGSWCDEGRDTSWNADWRIVCARGTLHWDGNDGVKAMGVKTPGAAGGVKTEIVEMPIPPVTLPHGGHKAMILDFIDCVRTGKSPICPCQDNIKSLAMVLSAVKSSRTGQKVKVEW